MNPMLREHALSQLEAAIDAAVAQNATLGSARQVILQPLRTLQALGQEATLALSGRYGAVERLRLLLRFAAPSALEILRAFHGHSPKLQRPREPACEAGVLRLGGLVLTGLAAGHSGPRAVAKEMVDVVHGIALAASPAESLARSLQHGLGADRVAAALESAWSPESSAIRPSMLIPSFMDDGEQARWACLEYLFGVVKDQVTEDWTGADSTHVSAVRRVSRDGAAALTFHVADADGVEPSALRGDDTVVLAWRDGAVFAPVLDVKKREVTVAVPAGARAGWVALAPKEARRAAAARRRAARERWKKELEGPCLHDDEVELDAIFDPDAGDAVPYASTPTNASSWGARILDATVVRRDGAVELAVSLARAREASRLRVDVGGGGSIDAAVSDGGARVPLPEALAARDVRGTVAVFARGRSDPDDTRAFEGAAPRPAKDDAGGGDGDGEGESEGSEPPPPSGPSAPGRRVVVVRPAVVRGSHLERVSSDALLKLQDSLRGFAALEELPFVPDADLVVEGEVDPGAPGASALLERLEGLAARCAGIDDATLLLLVPPPAPEASPNSTNATTALRASAASAPFATAPGETVATLLVTSPAGVRSGLQAAVAEPKPRLDRLRLVGTITRDDVVLTEPARLERRSAGAGAPYLTPYLAVGLDGSGEPLVSVRLRTLRSTRSGSFALLLPVTDKVSTIELRFEPDILAVELRAEPRTVVAHLASLEAPLRVATLPAGSGISQPVAAGRYARRPLPVLSRPAGSSSSGASPIWVEFAGETRADRVGWNVSHERGVRTTVDVEAGRRRPDGGVSWTRVLSRASSAGEETALGLDRLARGTIDEIRIVAGDGWNVKSLSRPLAVQARGLRIRSVDARRFWLELDDTYFDRSVEWRVYPAASYTAGSSAAAPPSAPAVLKGMTEIFDIGATAGDVVIEATWNGKTDRVVVRASPR